jgi:hypothetical protein
MILKLIKTKNKEINIGLKAYTKHTFFIQRRERWVVKIYNTLKFYLIKYKNVNEKNFWNVDRGYDNS